MSTPMLDLRAAQVTLRQDAGDVTTVRVECVDTAGTAYAIAEDWTDAEGLFTVDNTSKASGVIILEETSGLDAGVYPFRLRDANEVTWLEGELIVGDIGVGASRAGGRGPVRLVVDDDVTVRVTVSAVADSATYASSGCRAYQSSGQSIPPSTFTAVQFNAESFDDDSWHDNVTNNTRFTVPTGVERVRASGTVATLSGTDGKLTIAAIHKNGSVVSRGVQVQAGGTGTRYASVSDVLPVTAGDYIELFVFHNEAGAVNTQSGDEHTRFIIEKVPVPS